MISILNKFRVELDLLPLSEMEILPWISEGGINLITKALLVSDKSASLWLQKFRESYKDKNTSKDLLYNWVFSFLSYAKEQDFGLAVCSNKPEPLLLKALDETALRKFFPMVIGGSNKTKPKPDPERIERILSATDCHPTQAVMIGDSVIDQQTCTNAQIDFVWYTGGYQKKSDFKNVNLFFQDCDELKNIFKSRNWLGK